MKIWTPFCVLLLTACAATPDPSEATETGGSRNGTTSEGSSAGKSNPGNKGGGGGASNASGSTAGAAGSDETGNESGGHAEAAGSSGAGGKGGIGGGGHKTGTGGGNTGGGRTGVGGSAEIGGAKTGSDGGSGTGGKAGIGGSTGAGGAKERPDGGGTGGKAGIGGSTGSGGGNTGSGSNHVFLLLGQSNMAGYPKAQDSDKQKNQQIQVLGFDDCSATGRKSDQWDVAVPPLHECFQGAIGPGDWFSKTMISKYPAGDTIWLVPCAFSGEAIATMSKGGTHWDRIVSRAKKGQEKGPIEGMLFHQGESDCGNSQWPSWVNSMYTDLKSALSLTKDVPFLAGELPPDSKCSNHTPLVDKLPSVMGSFTYVISAASLTIDSSDTQWHMHFDHDSQVTFGKRYADTMIKALGL